MSENNITEVVIAVAIVIYAITVVVMYRKRIF